MKAMNDIIERAKNIKCLISDVDGVMTEGFLFIDDSGKEFKAFQVQDGVGMKLLMAAGIEMAVITTSRTNLIDHRMKQLGIHLYHTGQVNKLAAFEQIKSQLGLANEDFAYVGDDLPDLIIMKQVGLGIAVANAVAEVKANAHWQTENCGGHGAVREVCEFILKAQNKSELALENYLKQ
jgi:3-deoxy-D-manno-octulosonate 8-phosphate phosphatase (KDO 8-P phosphatase)